MKNTLVLILSVFSWSAVAQDKVIYGTDDRLDVYQVTDSAKLELADSTVALMENGSLVASGNKYRIRAGKFGEQMGLCADEPFYHQPSAAFCSGSLVGEDLLITAGHCVTSQAACKNTKFVFGFAVKEEGRYPTEVAANDVVGCKKLIKREQVNTGADYAVIQLDRKIRHHRPLAINRANDLRNGAAIGVIGHPSGLPTKVAYGAKVRNASASSAHFVANLDTYGGNSGSAVFNASTGKIEGILVRGAQDFVYENGCRRSNICSENGCRGEDVTKISALAALIPEI